MKTEAQIIEPFQFNPLKHHLGFIREFVITRLSVTPKPDITVLSKELRHIGTSIMDIYAGDLCIPEILEEVDAVLKKLKVASPNDFAAWAGTGYNEFRLITMPDSSNWILKYHNNPKRFVHIFPARSSPLTFRVKANTLKSAILYYMMVGKDYISRDDLNEARMFLELSPVKDTAETEAILEMIEILRK